MVGTLTLAQTREDLADALSATVGRVGFVPTMGALHAGHAALLRTAREAVGPGAPVVASIFVNPMQFGPGEDLDRYPRTLERDLETCAAAGVDLVFVPTVDTVYPGGDPQVTVDPGPLARVLEGASRPTHFHGVLTVVAKLLGLVRPDVAVFGEKDYQQLTLIQQMNDTLRMGIDVQGCPTVREADGLAMSSRNAYLTPEQRGQAAALSAALRAGAGASSGGADAVLAAAHAVIDSAPGIQLDYLALTDVRLGEPVPGEDARLLIAARVGKPRLLDNIHLSLPMSQSATRTPTQGE
jgi:pantoate--beta-alanine ligase